MSSQCTFIVSHDQTQSYTLLLTVGNKGLAGLISNPVIANGVAGLATSATAQATVERFVLWTLRDTVRFSTQVLHFCLCLLIRVLDCNLLSTHPVWMG